MSEMFGAVDQIALATFLTNKAVERSLSHKLEDARDALINKLVDILGVYKATMTSAGSGASPQLVTATNMKSLPLLVLGLLKHVRSTFWLATWHLTLPQGGPTTKRPDPVRLAVVCPMLTHDHATSASDSVPPPELLRLA